MTGPGTPPPGTDAAHQVALARLLMRVIASLPASFKRAMRSVGDDPAATRSALAARRERERLELKSNLRREAVDELLASMVKLRANPKGAVLGVSTRTVTTVDLACGGPSAWIEYEHANDKATFYTTAPGYEHSAPVQAVQLNEDEATEVETLLNLDALAESKGYPLDVHGGDWW